MLDLKISEGKKKSSPYELLAKTIFESEEKRDTFAHLCLVFNWCLVKREKKCFIHIHSHGDYLFFKLEKSKGHQK